MSLIEVFFERFISSLALIFEESKNLASEPLKSPNMLWTLIPLIVGMFILEIYFGHYKREKLGWSSAVGNSLMLFFVGMNLFSYLFSSGFSIILQKSNLTLIGPQIVIVKYFIAGFIVFEAALLFVLNFFHLAPKKFAFGISSGLFVNFLACMGIILVYGNLSLNWTIIPGILLLFFGLLVFLALLEFIEPKSWRNDDTDDDDDL